MMWDPFNVELLFDHRAPLAKTMFRLSKDSNSRSHNINQTRRASWATYVLFFLCIDRVCIFYSVIFIEAMYIFMICFLNKCSVSTKINQQITKR